jgi:hypothetical protein
LDDRPANLARAHLPPASQMRKIVHTISPERIMALVDRVKNTLLSPRSELQVIDAEPATINSLYLGYIAPLAAIPAICQAIGWTLIGVSIPFVGGRIRIPVTTAIVRAIVTYIIGLIGVYIGAFIIDALAPTFGGTKNMVQSLKVVAFAATPVWVAGILNLVPALFMLQILVALYSLYLLYLALPVLMKSPADKAAGYTVVVLIACFIVGAIIAVVMGALGLTAMGTMGAMGSGYHP